MTFQYHNDILCIVSDVLYSELQLLTYEAYLKKCTRGTLKRERNASPGKKALVNYPLLPEDWKAIIVEKKGDPYKTVKHQTFADFIVRDIAAANYFRDYVYNENTSLSLDKQREYCVNAEVLNAVNLIVSNRKAKCRAMGNKAKRVWENMSEILINLDKTKYPHTLPTNPRSIQRVVQRYNKMGYEGLIHKNFGNSNSEKINENAKMWVLSRWADQVRRVANEQQLFLEYNAVAAQKGWKPLSDHQPIYLFLHREDIQELWWAHRYGELKAKEKFNFQHSTRLPSMRDSLWYSDGTKLNYFYQDEAGKVCTTSVYEIMDSYSEALIGYHISDKEDYQTQYSAFKMAVQTSGYKPYQLGFDNQGGHKKLAAGSFLEKISRLAIKTQPYNGKSKTIENAFYRFQSQFLKQDWFFTGQNIQAKKQESKANLEYINANKANLPTLAEIRAVYKQRRDEWNNAAHHSTGLPRLQMYLNSQNEATPKVELWDMVDIFWVERPEPVMYNAYGLTFREKNQKHTYTVCTSDGLPDMNFHVKNIDKKFFIKFDPEDMETVLLYDKDSSGNLRFVSEAKTKITIARGKQEQEAFDHQYIASLKKLNDQARIERVDVMEEILSDHGRSSEDYGMNTAPVLGLTSSRKKKKAKAAATDFGQVLKTESEIVHVPKEGDQDDELDIYSRM